MIFDALNAHPELRAQEVIARRHDPILCRIDVPAMSL